MARYEIKTKNFLTEPIISPNVDRVLVFVFSFMGTFAGIILKSVTEWSYWTIIFVVFVMAVVLICILKLGRMLLMKFNKKECD